MTAWPKVPLGDVLVQNKEYIAAPEARMYPKLSVKLYGKGVALDTPADGTNLKMQKHQIAKAGQVILSEIWGKKGAIGFVPPEGEGALCTSHFFLFDVRTELMDARWLQAVFTANYLEKQLDLEAKGTTGYAAVRPAHLLRATIPLPPLEEQRRIVEHLDCLALKVRSASQLAADCAQQGDLVLSRWISQLRFDECDWKRLASTAVDKPGAVRSGPFGSQLHHEEFVTEGITAIGTRDVQVNRLILQSGWYVRPEKFAQFRRYEVFPGDLLCTIVGASIGRFCIVPEKTPTAFTTKHVMALTLRKEVVEPEFASEFLNTHQRCRRSIFSQCEGSAQPSLNARKVLAIEIPLPPLDRQREILCQIHKLRAECDPLETLSSSRMRELGALMPSILNRAFSGQL